MPPQQDDARGLDTGNVADARLAVIEAFPPGTPPSFEQTFLRDARDDADDLWRGIAGREWLDVRIDAFLEAKDAIWLFSADGLRYYFPSLLLALLDDNERRGDILYDYACSLLTPPQAAMSPHRASLWAVIADLPTSQLHAVAAAARAIEPYWADDEAADESRREFWTKPLVG